MKKIWSSSSGRIELEFTQEQYESVPIQGPADDVVLVLSKIPNISKQFEQYSDKDIAAYLRDFGAWSEDDLASRCDNIQRVIWMACLDLRENEQEELEV